MCLLPGRELQPPATLTVPVAHACRLIPLLLPLLLLFFYKLPKMQGFLQLASACERPGPRGQIQPKSSVAFTQRQPHRLADGLAIFHVATTSFTPPAPLTAGSHVPSNPADCNRFPGFADVIVDRFHLDSQVKVV